MKFQFIQEYCWEFGVRRMCRVLNVSKSRYYAWKKKPLSNREKEDSRILVEIKDIHHNNRQTYGVPRMQKTLIDNGFKCGKNRIGRIMRENGIKPKTVKKFKATTDSRHNLEVFPNLLNRNFKPEKPNQVWVSDITYVPTQEGWLYLCIVLDLFSRKIIGWSMSENMKSEIVVKALKMAFWKRNVPEGLVFHSDRGSQYASIEVRSYMKNKGVVQSMSRKGNCWDNAPAESFFKTLKVEELYFKVFKSREKAKSVIFDYIEVFYNRRRLHSTLGYVSPERYEALNEVA